MKQRPKTRKALKEAIKDMNPEIKQLKKELNPGPYDNYVVGSSYLDTKEQRYLNELLGLNTNEGIEQWYKKS